MATENDPKLVAAIVKGVIIDVVLIAIGVAIYVATGELLWLLGATMAGFAVIILLMAQAGGLARKDERR